MIRWMRKKVLNKDERNGGPKKKLKNQQGMRVEKESERRDLDTRRNTYS